MASSYPTVSDISDYENLYMVSQAIEDAHNLFRDEESDENLLDATQTVEYMHSQSEKLNIDVSSTNFLF